MPLNWIVIISLQDVGSHIPSAMWWKIERVEETTLEAWESETAFSWKSYLVVVPDLCSCHLTCMLVLQWTWFERVVACSGICCCQWVTAGPSVAVKYESVVLQGAFGVVEESSGWLSDMIIRALCTILTQNLNPISQLKNSCIDQLSFEIPQSPYAHPCVTQPKPNHKSR